MREQKKTDKLRAETYEEIAMHYIEQRKIFPDDSFTQHCERIARIFNYSTIMVRTILIKQGLYTPRTNVTTRKLSKQKKSHKNEKQVSNLTF